MDAIVIRRFRASDRRGFVGLVRELAKFENLKGPGRSAAARLVSDIGRRIEVLMGIADDRPVAYAIYFYTYSSFLARPTLYLEDLFVLPTFRRRGMASRMIRWLKREARGRKCGRMEWMVLDWNRKAQKTYRRLGARQMKEWLPYRVAL